MNTENVVIGVPVQLAQKIADYLGQQKYLEVKELMDGLQSVRAVSIAPPQMELPTNGDVPPIKEAKSGATPVEATALASATRRRNGNKSA